MKPSHWLHTRLRPNASPTAAAGHPKPLRRVGRAPGGARPGGDRVRQCHGHQAVVRPATVDDRLQQRPLGHEPRSDGQCGRAESSDPEREGSDWHPGAEPAHPVEVALTGAMQHRAGREEQRALERGMAGDQQQTGRDRGVGATQGVVGPAQERVRERGPGSALPCLPERGEPGVDITSR